MELLTSCPQSPRDLWSVIVSLMLFLSQLKASQAQSLTTTSSNATDQLALIHFKSMISKDPYGALASWNFSLHFCEWRGVSCHDRQHPGSVTALDLDSLGIAGAISPYLANMTFLKRLNLPNNNLYGSIPQELGRLSRLRYLNMRINSLAGEIPSTLGNCTNLRILSLRNNKLHGVIPADLGRCTDLRTISLSNNTLEGEVPSQLGSLQKLQTLILSFTNLRGSVPPSLGNLAFLSFLLLSNNTLWGVIPSSLGNLSSVTYINLSGNNLSGGIPPSIGKLSSLSLLDLSLNQLSGILPSSLYNLSGLNFLGVSGNKLSGTLPPDLANTLQQLEKLDMYDNQFHGFIPPSLANATELQRIQLHENGFKGLIPHQLGTLQKLFWLTLYKNQLEAKNANEWSFITDLTNCSSLRVLIVSHNNLSGMLPASIVNFSTSLEWLTLGHNQISGSIPAEIGNLVSLNIFDVGPNHLTGGIPSTIGKLQQLQTLDLSENLLSGEIPHTIGNLTKLNRLYLGPNNLNGSIPPNLGNCRDLELLDLTINQLTGKVPKEIVSISSLSDYLRLSNNLLTRSLPTEVGIMKNLNILDVANNKLSREIPSTLGECLVMEYLWMRGNFFQGIVPQSLSNLKGLQILDLSHNNLSGHIPDFLESFQFLQYLNLSYNNFKDELPRNGIFRNSSAVSISGNDQLCGGRSIFKLPPCPIISPKRKHKFHFLIVAVSVASAVVCFIMILCAIVLLVKRSRKKSSTITSLKNQHTKVSYSQLCKATNGFASDNLIGMGSFGSVYKGTIVEDCERLVAIKVLNLQQRGASESFTAECEVLRTVRHRNLLKIITSCSSMDYQGNDFKALVFKYLTNGSLEIWLHPQAHEGQQPRNLNLIQRLNIAVDVASALEYLHCHGPTEIVHCDLNPSNVVLDDDMTAHVADFGLARFLDHSAKYQTGSMFLRGSIGYVAPEYGIGGEISTQGDIYSYGILLLEMFTGRRPTDDAFKEGLDLHEFVAMAFPGQIMDIVDPHLLPRDIEEASASSGIRSTNDLTERKQECLVSIFRIGLSCSKESPRDRMQMEDVSKEMHAIRERLLGQINR